MRVLLITGSMGSGKTTVLGEASDLLAARGVIHAAIDTDALANGFLPPDVELQYRNLRAVCDNFIAAGVERFLIAQAVETQLELDALRRSVDNADVVVCRLMASLETMQSRIRVREPGWLQQQFVNRSEALEKLLDAARLEDFSIVNDQRPITDVATELLTRAGWW